MAETTPVNRRDGIVEHAEIVRPPLMGIAITKRLPCDEHWRRKYVLTLVDFGGLALGDRHTMREALALRDQIISRFGKRLAAYLKRTRIPATQPRRARQAWQRELAALIYGEAQ